MQSTNRMNDSINLDPQTLQLTLAVTFLVGGILSVADTPFTAAASPGSDSMPNGVRASKGGEGAEGGVGRWVLDPAGRSLTMEFHCTGYQRTFVTKGSLASAFGGATGQTSSAYSVPVRCL